MKRDSGYMSAYGLILIDEKNKAQIEEARGMNFFNFQKNVCSLFIQKKLAKLHPFTHTYM